MNPPTHRARLFIGNPDARIARPHGHLRLSGINRLALAAAGPGRAGHRYFTMAVAELRTTYNRAFILRFGKGGREAIGLELAELSTRH
jgi:hypothetical protein